MLGVVGTDTEVGKTAVTAALARALGARGWRVAALKAVATGVPPGCAGEDAEALAQATGAAPADCLGTGLRLPRSPLAAARAEGVRIDVEALAETVRRRAAVPDMDLLLVEGAGGLLVPLTERETIGGLLRRLDAPVLLVARAGLGTVNHTALTVEACRGLGLDLAGVVLNDLDGRAAAVDPGFAAENAAQVADQCGVPVLGVLPHVERPVQLDAGELDLARLERALRRPRVDAGEVVRLDRAHVWHPFTQTSEWRAEEPLVIVRGQGCRLVDAEGREYLDAISSLWANVHGHAHPRLDAALREQAGRVAHATFLGQTHEPGARLAAELAAAAPPGLTRVFFSEAGAAAVEVGLRVVLLAQRHRGQPGRTRFLSLEEAYHGDTAGSVSVGFADPFHRGLDPLLAPGVLRLPPPHVLRVRQGLTPEAAEAASLTLLRELLDRHGDELAGVVVEPRVQGAAGMLVHSDEWLRDVAAATRAAGALLLCDEVAVGFGRTGDLFASAGAAVTPDVLALGKGLTGGYLPMSATLVPDELFELFTAPYAEHRTLYYGHTYSGNPLASAVARASLALFHEEGTVERGRRLAARLARRLADLAALAHVAEVRQRGVMVGVELAEAGLERPFDPALRVGRRVVLAARRRGVIVRPLGDVVVLNPPLVMEDRDADRVVEVLAESIAEATAPSAVSAGRRRSR
jgi:adenosylmethionine---8-amino-7-oxononanoate aminotransferase